VQYFCSHLQVVYNTFGCSDPALRDPVEHLDHVGADRDDIRPPAPQLLRVLVGQHDIRQANPFSS
jgi:hypothetical protein